MKKYYYVSIINDTTNIYITSKEETEKQLLKNNFISFIAHGNKVIATRGITFENAQKELNEIIEDFKGGSTMKEPTIMFQKTIHKNYIKARRRYKIMKLLKLI